jgi:hypothetical protein
MRGRTVKLGKMGFRQGLSKELKGGAMQEASIGTSKKGIKGFWLQKLRKLLRHKQL